ncbi:MAG: hypothetical protein B5M51_01665, partial [Anaerolinea sp. 4484_236]
IAYLFDIIIKTRIVKNLLLLAQNLLLKICAKLAEFIRKSLFHRSFSSVTVTLTRVSLVKENFPSMC